MARSYSTGSRGADRVRADFTRKTPYDKPDPKRMGGYGRLKTEAELESTRRSQQELTPGGRNRFMSDDPPGSDYAPAVALKNEWAVGLKPTDIEGQNGEPLGIEFADAFEKYPELERVLDKGLKANRDKVMNDLLDEAFKRSGSRPDESGYVVKERVFEANGMTFAISAELEYFTDEEGEVTTPMVQKFFVRRTK